MRRWTNDIQSTIDRRHATSRKTLSTEPGVAVPGAIPEKRVVQALRGAAGRRRGALSQRCKAAIDIATINAVGLQANR